METTNVVVEVVVEIVVETMATEKKAFALS